MLLRPVLSTSTVVALTLGIASADAPYFVGVGFLPNGSYSVIHGVSGDGRTAVGYASSSHGRFEAFRWTRAGGIEALPDIDGRTVEVYSWAWDASVDGTLIVGEVLRKDQTVKAFRWSAERGMIDLGDLPGGYTYSSARTISGDGKVVAGESVSKQGHPDVEAFIWDEVNGMRSVGYTPTGKRVFRVTELDFAGQWCVGDAGYDPKQPLLWCADSGWEELQLWKGSGYGTAAAISADGRIVVGFAGDRVDGRLNDRPFRWTETDGMQNLGFGPDGAWSGNARAVSGDGSVITGWGPAGGRHYDPVWIWDADQGLRALEQILTDEYGLDLSNWELVDAHGISDDGRTIVGYGNHSGYGTEGWVAHLGQIAPGDANCDHAIDFNDIDAFVLALTDPDEYDNQYGQTCDRKYADVNGDGAVDFNDIDAFVGLLTR